jgi:hypothetical protein
LLDDLDRLLAQGAQALGKSRLRRRDPDQLFTACRNLDVPAARSARACQGGERRQGPLPVLRLPNAHFEAAVACRETAERDALLAQRAAHVITQTGQDRLTQSVGVDLEQDARSALLPECRFGIGRLRGAQLFQLERDVGREPARRGQQPRQDEAEARAKPGRLAQVEFHGALRLELMTFLRIVIPLWFLWWSMILSETAAPPGSRPGQAFSGSRSGERRTADAGPLVARPHTQVQRFGCPGRNIGPVRADATCVPRNNHAMFNIYTLPHIVLVSPPPRWPESGPSWRVQWGCGSSGALD